MRTVPWSVVKRLANSNYARMTILVPIIGWLLVADDELLKLAAHMTNYAPLAKPSWRLYAFQSGLTLIGVAIALFYATCPAIIRNYRDFRDFVDQDARTVTRGQIAEYERIATAKGEQVEQFAAAASLVNPDDGNANARDLWFRRNHSTILAAQYAYYNSMEYRTNNLAKFLILLIAIPGLVLTLAPTADTVLTSLHHIYDDIIGFPAPAAAVQDRK